jgi:cell wall-associated NlpC family hydrolase
MQTRGELAAAEAREWCGTPFRWQQAVKGPGGGADCKMLIAGIARECGFPEARSIYANMASYSPRKPVDCQLLIQGLSEVFDKASDIRIGDVLLLKFKGRPQHLAIVTAEDRAVHAQLGPKDWVKETRLAALLRHYPLHTIFRWRDL